MRALGGWSMTNGEAIALDAFRVTMEDLAGVDVEKLHALSVMVGWPHRPEDWRLLRQFGQGFAALDEIGRVLGTAMWFPFGTEFATIGMVITSPRVQAQGAGRTMMEHVLAQTGARALGLNATRAARRLYLTLGFTPECTVFQHQGQAATPPAAPLPDGAALRDVGPGDIAALAVLDRVAYGADRTALLARLLELSRGVALLRGGRIQAFALCRPFGRGHVVGPVVASTDEDAIVVSRPHVADCAGSFLRVDTRQEEGGFSRFLSGSGLRLYDTVTSMSLRRPWPVSPARAVDGGPITYALVSQAVG